MSDDARTAEAPTGPFRAIAQRSRALSLTICFFISGAGGLMQSILWEKLLSGRMGHTSGVSAWILAVYMIGLGLGNFVFGRAADRTRRPLFWFAGLEIAAGIVAILALGAAPWIYDALLSLQRAGSLSPSGGWALEAAVAAGLIFPAVFLMGGSLPMLAALDRSNRPESRRRLAFWYFINSLGASAGAILAGYWLIPAYGIPTASLIAGLANLAAGVGVLKLALFLGESGESDPAMSPEEPDLATGGIPFAYGRPLAFCFGWMSFALEIAWVRMLANVLGGSTYSFCVMTATFVFGLAMGGYVARALFAGRSPQRMLLGAQAAALVGMLLLLPLLSDLPFFFTFLRSLFSGVPDAFYAYEASKFLSCFLIISPVTIALGVQLPALTASLAPNRKEGAGWGGQVGSVFGWDTLGAAVGAVSAGVWLLPWLNFDGLYRAAYGGGVVGLGLTAVGLSSRNDRLKTTSRLAVAGACIGVFLHAPIEKRMFAMTNFRYGAHEVRHEEMVANLENLEINFMRDDRAATVAVKTNRLDGNVSLLINNKADGSSQGSDLQTQRLIGLHAVMALDDPKDAMVIGMGTGVTAGVVAALPSVQRLKIVEISEAVMEASDYFADLNDNVRRDPRTQVVIDDAINHLGQDTQKYDLIVSEPSNPWIAGIGNLYSTEAFRRISDRLTDRGVYVMWFHLYEMDESITNAIFRTLDGAFPHFSVWLVSTSGEDIVAVCSKRPLEMSPDAVDARFHRPELARSWAEAGIVTPLHWHLLQISHEKYLRYLIGEGPVNTLSHPFLEYRAPLAYFGDREDDFRRMDIRIAQRPFSESYAARYFRERADDPEALARTAEALLYDKGWEEIREPFIDFANARFGEHPALRALAKRSPTRKDEIHLDRLREIAAAGDDIGDTRRYLGQYLELLKIRSAGFHCPDLTEFGLEVGRYVDRYGSLSPGTRSEVMILFNRCGAAPPSRL